MSPGQTGFPDPYSHAGELLSLWQESGYSALMVTHDVEEALLLANKVVVFSPRPARILQTIEVTLPYPRRRNDPQLVELRTQVLELLGMEDNIEPTA